LPVLAAAAPTFEKLGGVVACSDEEAERNPRARSAKLRAALRTDTPARAGDISIFGLPELPYPARAEMR
jgi:16S rRNA (cytosine1402-N4)-methyltransferase